MRRSLTKRLPQLLAGLKLSPSENIACAIDSASILSTSRVSHIPSLSGRPLLCQSLISTSPRFFASLPSHTELAMPALSPTMSQGNIIEWKVMEGQEVAPGDVLAEVETDKATLSWENQDEGFIAKLLVPAGTQGVHVGAPVAILVDDADSVIAFKDYNVTADQAASGSSTAKTAPTPASTSTQSIQPDSRIGPAARHYLEDSGIPLHAVQPTGPHHMITKGDVLAAIESRVSSSVPINKPADANVTPPATTTATTTTTAERSPRQQPQQSTASLPKPSSTAPSNQQSYTDIPTTQVRRIIAQRLLESKTTIPHLYLSTDVSLDGIIQLRDALKSQGIKVSVNDCVIKAAALALAAVPASNARWDAATETLIPSPSVDISIAVATEGGLITPIVKNADTKSLTAIAAEVRELASRARQNKLKPEEFQGGSFSISNLGMFGVDQFYAIINPPQACIMAVGGARSVAKLGPKGAQLSTTMMTVTLSADNRVYDGEIASRLLEEFSLNMNSPYRMLGV